LAETGRAAALIAHGVDGIPYLDKFVVTPEAQGEGLAAALWQILRARCPRFYWRSRASNPIAGWYLQQAHANFRQGEWIVHLIGIDDFGLLERLVQDARSRDSGWREDGLEH